MLWITSEMCLFLSVWYLKSIQEFNLKQLTSLQVNKVEVFMKQSHDSSDDHKFPVTANETLSEKTAVLM